MVVAWPVSVEVSIRWPSVQITLLAWFCGSLQTRPRPSRDSVWNGAPSMKYRPRKVTHWGAGSAAPASFDDGLGPHANSNNTPIWATRMLDTVVARQLAVLVNAFGALRAIRATSAP